MAEDNFKGILFGFILVTLFATLMITAVNYEGALYGKDTTMVTGGSLNVGNFSNEINTVSTNAETLRERFEKQNIFVALGDLVISGVFDIAVDMIQMIITPFTLISNILTNVFQIPSFVTNTILGLLILSMLFGIWRLIKVGD
jgi:hypothetical protein